MRDFIFALIGTCLLVSAVSCSKADADTHSPRSIGTNGGRDNRNVYVYVDYKEDNVCYITAIYPSIAMSCVPRRHV